MKKQLIISLFITTIMFAGAYNSFAEMYGCKDISKGVMQEESMPQMRGMQHQGMGMMGEEHPMWRHLMSLDLNEKQKAEISEISNRVLKEMIKKRADENIAGIEMKELIDKDPVDLKAVETKLKQIETLKTEMHLSLIRATEEIKTKLTSMQRKKFKEATEIGPIIEGRDVMQGMMRSRMRVPPPCDIQNEMHSEMEHMPGPPLHEIPMQRDSER